MRNYLINSVLLLCCTLILTACSSTLPISHKEQLYIPEKNSPYYRPYHHIKNEQPPHGSLKDSPSSLKGLPRSLKDHAFVHTSWSGSLATCPPAGTTKFIAPPSDRKYLPPQNLPTNVHLSKGDMINLTVRDGEEFNGDYVVDQTGRINVPYVGRTRAIGQTLRQLELHLTRRMISKQLFKRGFQGVSVRLINYAAIQIAVDGAVFYPGFVTINEIKTKELPPRSFGDSALRRRLNFALKGGYGVRPDADLSSVLLKRRGQIYQIDMRGAITGRPVINPVLEEGDEVHVPSSGCFQTALVRPSEVTPKGIRIYVSKMAKGQGPDSTYSENMPYGIRLLRAAVIDDCVGGSTASNGKRYVVLVSNNPVTNRTEVIQRSIEELVRGSHRDEINPYLMPDDGVACYDSDFTEVVNFLSYLTSISNNVRSMLLNFKPLNRD